MNRSSKTVRRKRRAAVLIMAMVVLLVLTLLGGELVRTMVVAHRQSARNNRELQCLWLAEAGVERAVVQLNADPTYDGETWQPVVDETAATDAAERRGRVSVVVVTEDGQRQIRIQAIYPDHPTDRALVERTHSLPPAEEESP